VALRVFIPEVMRQDGTPASPHRWGGNHGSAKCLPLPDVERLNNENIP